MSKVGTCSSGIRFQDAPKTFHMNSISTLAIASDGITRINKRLERLFLLEFYFVRSTTSLQLYIQFSHAFEYGDIHLVFAILRTPD